jgi:hypothetical protein
MPSIPGSHLDAVNTTIDILLAGDQEGYGTRLKSKLDR